MQNKCTTVISHLANISCSSVKRLSIHKESATVSTDNAELRVAHVLSMDAVLNVGLDVGQVSSALLQLHQRFLFIGKLN